MNELNNKLRDRAVECGLCQQWQGDWMESKSKQELIDMYIRGIDFCIANNYPSNDFIVENFDTELLEDNNIFVNREVSVSHPRRFALFSGNCSGEIEFGRNDVCDVYIKDDCEISLRASGFSRISVNVYGSAKVSVKQSDVSKVFVYRHSDRSTVMTEGEVVVRDREKED